MRITITMHSDRDIILPVHYHHILQGFLYTHISDRDYREFLHQEGFGCGKRKFKLFTFSRLQGTFKLDQDKNYITFKSPVDITVASPLEPFITDLAETLMKSDELYLGSNRLQLKSINVHKPVVFKEKMRIKMMSPVVAHTTEEINGKRRTTYFSPWDVPFDSLILSNLNKKYWILKGKYPEGDLKVVPCDSHKDKFLKIIRYKNFIIKGYLGNYYLVGDPELMEIAYYTGLGAKNSQGFGCFEVEGVR
ncbi:CRISPR-associated endoribonuclease Cas6 [Thermosyntropha lipolytica DSM 11003]|uniref:CRISPR-associated endoribonuclease n=1 Tax=Thermosyntropha lipolytica DSM 11003 TaxID=1123382 RepID=A0A1M5KAF5_9FIRM|nr:CRISPR-associated endoribonuclease Cas6 [Thermosyntropha lipolytica]SHG49718.1 CRISPR-associated endoribonuclease Cas6 [Thermosyntropha lipolytica DSM 11003]